MKNLHIFCFIFISYFCFSQSVDDLDVKNGFRNFKLGSSPLQNKNIEKREKQNATYPTTEVYEYTGKDIESIFGVNVEKVSLLFFKNKLFSIRVSFGYPGHPFELKEFNIIQTNLEETYGKNWEPLNGEFLLNGCVWEGKNVTLELCRGDFDKNKTEDLVENSIFGYMHVFDKKLMKEMYQSNF